MTPTLTLYTIGHSNLPAEEFLALLQRYQITVLVDVRSAPYSRYLPHFNRRELQVFLVENGIDYRFAGEYLGGQPKDPEFYKTLPDETTKREKFLKIVHYEAVMQREWYQQGIQRLLAILEETALQGGHVAIMCSEGDPHECHRHHLIVRSLLDPQVRIVEAGVNVKHILQDGTLEAADASVFEVRTPQQRRLL